MKRKDKVFVVALGLFLVIAIISSAVNAATIPPLANTYKRQLIRAAHTHWGLDAPVARFAAQVHQESAWKKDAQSIYAKGLAQFTPETAKWIDRVYHIGDTPFSPNWSLNALVRYDRHIYEHITNSATDCDRWAFVLSGYNGGPGWIRRDRALAAENKVDPNRWFHAVEYYTSRRESAARENRNYVQRILLKLEPLYLVNGWQGTQVCGGE